MIVLATHYTLRHIQVTLSVIAQVHARQPKNCKHYLPHFPDTQIFCLRILTSFIKTQTYIIPNIKLQNAETNTVFSMCLHSDKVCPCFTPGRSLFLRVEVITEKDLLGLLPYRHLKHVAHQENL